MKHSDVSLWYQSNIHLFLLPCYLLFSQAPTWINGATNDSPKWIPCSVIKPVVELIKTFFCQEAGCAVVKVPGNVER